MKEFLRIFFSIILALIIFFSPWIIGMVFATVLDSEDVGWIAMFISGLLLVSWVAYMICKQNPNGIVIYQSETVITETKG